MNEMNEKMLFKKGVEIAALVYMGKGFLDVYGMYLY